MFLLCGILAAVLRLLLSPCTYMKMQYGTLFVRKHQHIKRQKPFHLSAHNGCINVSYLLVVHEAPVTNVYFRCDDWFSTIWHRTKWFQRDNNWLFNDDYVHQLWKFVYYFTIKINVFSLYTHVVRIIIPDGHRGPDYASLHINTFW